MDLDAVFSGYRIRLHSEVECTLMTVAWQISEAYGPLLWLLSTSYPPLPHTEEDEKIKPDTVVPKCRNNVAFNKNPFSYFGYLPCDVIL